MSDDQDLGRNDPGDRNETVARALGWVYEPRFEGDGAGYWVATDGTRYISEDLPDFVGSLDACRLVEGAIARRGLVEKYQNALIALLGLDMQIFSSVIELNTRQLPEVLGNTFEWEGHATLWLYSQATCDQRCHAALRALGIDI